MKALLIGLLILFVPFVKASDIDGFSNNLASGDQRFDSLEVRFVGNWPFGYWNATCVDSLRSLACFTSGGGVYLLDVTTPSSPVIVSDALRTRGRANGLCYDASTFTLYIADDIGGLEIWNITNPASPAFMGSLIIEGNANEVRIIDTLAFALRFDNPYKRRPKVDP